MLLDFPFTRHVPSRRGTGSAAAILSVGGALLLSGCATSAYQKYSDPNDACRPNREPIIAAGNQVQTYREQQANYYADRVIAQQQASGQGGNMVQRALTRDQLKQEAILRLDTGQAADGSGPDKSVAQFRGAAAAIRALRECRRRQIAAYKSQVRPRETSSPYVVAQMNYQRAALNIDDELVKKVFGKAAEQATVVVYRGPSGGGGGGAGPVRRASVGASHGDSEHAKAAAADKKESDTLHASIDN